MQTVKMGNRSYKSDKVLTRKFGQKIKELRLLKGLRQDALAFEIKISPSYLSAIERGITDTTISTAKRCAKAFDISLSKLFDFE